MKLLIWGLILSLNLTGANAGANDPTNCEHCKPKLSGQPTSGELRDIEKIAGHDDSKIQNLAQSICSFFAWSGANFQSDFKYKIEKHMKEYEGISNPTPKQITDFLNKNKDKMTCGSGKNKKNYMMVAFDENAQIALFERIFLREYIKNDRSAKIDVNAVSYTGPGGTPETVLDYMDGLIDDKSQPEAFIKEVASLRNFFVKKLGAKKFNEFDAATQAGYKM